MVQSNGIPRRHVAALLILAPLAARALEHGVQAPDFSLPGPSGPVRLADFKGKTLYLDFWASWCVPCKQSFPWMNDMQAKYKDRGLRILGVNVDKHADDATHFLERVPAAFALAMDPAGDVPRSYSVKAMPTSVLIGPAGQVLEFHAGFSQAELGARELEIRRALGLP
jgi:cytochrome c biogenesis protein CcmG, thiol:disulfide interchange protein DsbE